VPYIKPITRTKNFCTEFVKMYDAAHKKHAFKIAVREWACDSVPEKYNEIIAWGKNLNRG